MSVQRWRYVEDENRRLKKLLAESMLDLAALRDLPGRNRNHPKHARPVVIVSNNGAELPSRDVLVWLNRTRALLH